MPMFLAEHYLTHDDPELLRLDAQRVSELARASPTARLLWCLHAAQDATVFWLFEAADEAEVGDVARRVGFAVDRISPVVPLT